MQNIAISYFFTMTIYWSSTGNICCYSICLFCWGNIHNCYNFITLNHWSISNFFSILDILTNAYARIPTIIFFACTIIFTFILTCFIIPFLIWITSHRANICLWNIRGTSPWYIPRIFGKSSLWNSGEYSQIMFREYWF